MPEGDKTAQEGAPTPGPAPVGGSAIVGTAPTGLDAGGGGKQAPGQPGQAVAPQSGQPGTQAPSTGGWDRARSETHFQTLYQKTLAEKKELEAKLAQASVAPPAPAATGTQAAPSDVETRLSAIWETRRRGTVDQYLKEVREDPELGEAVYLHEAQRLGIIRMPTPQVAPAQAAPQQAVDPDTIRQIARQEYETAYDEGMSFRERLAAFAAPYGGDAFLKEQITVTTPQGQLTMSREKAATMYRRFTGKDDPRTALNEVDPAGMEAARDRVAEQRVWEAIRAKQAAGQVYVGPAGVPGQPAVPSGMATPTAALSDELTKQAVASSRFGTDVSAKPTFAPGK